MNMIKMHIIKSLKNKKNIVFKNINLGLLNMILHCVYIIKNESYLSYILIKKEKAFDYR